MLVRETDVSRIPEMRKIRENLDNNIKTTLRDYK